LALSETRVLGSTLKIFWKMYFFYYEMGLHHLTMNRKYNSKHKMISKAVPYAGTQKIAAYHQNTKNSFLFIAMKNSKYLWQTQLRATCFEQ